MNVKELIEQLERMPPELEVKFAYNYGDYWKTEVAATVRSVDVADVTYSLYHQMDKTVDYDAEQELDDEERAKARERHRAVVILES